MGCTLIEFKMKLAIGLALFLLPIVLYGQKEVEDFGYRSFQIKYLNEPVELIIKSKKGEDSIRKPLFIFFQGSLAKPLVTYNDKGVFFSPFPFSEELVIENYHLVAISKPGVPLIENKKNLNSHGEFIDPKTRLPSLLYTENNNLEYYTTRNSQIINYLVRQDWVNSKIIVIAGHSEGSSIAVNTAKENTYVSHLIYSGGSIYFPRMLSMLSQDRRSETKEQSWVEKDFEYWKKVVKNPSDTSRAHGFNSYKGTFSFSQSLNEDLKNFKLPVLISYGSKDTAAAYNDLFQLEVIKSNQSNIEFMRYLGLEHNYFPYQNGEIDYSNFGWNKVAEDWLRWIDEN
jgi:pimeloyl-ACP methyl ester carboxylesterase